MRTPEEIKADIDTATNAYDASWLHALSAEVLEQGALDSPAWSANLEGLAFRMAGQYAQAHEAYSRGLALYEQIGNKVGMAGTIGNLGTIHASRGEYAQALEAFNKALAIREELGERGEAAAIAANIGSIHASIGEYAKALEQYERARGVFEQLGNREAVAMLTDNIGNVFVAAGDYPRALERYGAALAVHEECGDLDNVARVTGNIGNVYANIGDWDRARQLYERSMALYRDLGDPAGIAFAESSLGVVCNSMQDHDQALRHFQQARQIALELGDRARLARYTTNVLTCNLKQGRIAEATQLLREVEQLEPDDPEIRVQIVISRASIQEHEGELEAAHQTLLEALESASTAGLKMRTADTHRSIRDLARKRNDFDAYVEHGDAYHAIKEEISGRSVTQQLGMVETQQALEAVRREREKEQAVLYGALPKEIADRLIGGDDVSGDEYEHASVLFLDITESTRHASALTAKQVVGLLSEVFSTFDDIAAEHGLLKIKTIGDAYMAVAFPDIGEQTSDISPEQRAANAALDMLASEFHWPSATATDNSNRIQFRIGLHAGPLVAGIIGKRRLQYDVWGDTVNVASRMESTGEPGKIQVSSPFATALGNGQWGIGNRDEPHSPFPIPYSLTERGEVNVKGKGLMTTYWLESA